MTEEEVQIRVRQRLGLPASQGPRILTLIAPSLEKLARTIANDPIKRPLLLTDKTSVTAVIASSGSDYYAELSTAISTNGVMLDFLEYGTIYYRPDAIAFTANATTDNGSTASANGFWEGMKAQVSSSGTLPAGLSTVTDYYLGSVSTSKSNFIFKFATSRANAFAATAVDLTDTGSGTHTITPWEYEKAQFYNREFGPEAQFLPTHQTRVWLVGTKLFTNMTVGTFSFTVPFVPTLATLPAKLDMDLIDTAVELYQLSSEINNESK